jgi:hypothetical protein
MQRLDLQNVLVLPAIPCLSGFSLGFTVNYYSGCRELSMMGLGLVSLQSQPMVRPVEDCGKSIHRATRENLYIKLCQKG